MAPPRKISHSCSAGTLPTFSQLHVGGDGLLLVPPPCRPQPTHQGHAHIAHNNGLLRVWVEVRGAGIHVFPHEAASLPSIVVAQLDQCDVTTSLRETNPAHSVRIARQGKEQLNLFFEAEEEAETWANMLRVTTVNRSLALEGLNLECGGAGTDKDADKSSSLELLEGIDVEMEEEELEEEEEDEEGEDDDDDDDECDDDEEEDEGDDEFAMEALDTFLGLLNPIYCADEDTTSGDSCETESQEEGEGHTPDDGADGRTYVRLRHPRRNAPPKPRDEAGRRELLQQMLATKSLLEKKQKNRKSGAGAWAITAGEVVNEYDRAQHEAQQLALRKAVLLKQRKNSTAIKMATLERQQHSSSKKQEGDVSLQLEALRRRLSSLDSELKESEQDTERTLQDLEERRNQELHLIKDLGGVQDDGLPEGLVGVSKSWGSEEGVSHKGSLGGSLRGSLSSIPSIVISSSERRTPERIFGFKVGNRDGKAKGRNPLHFLDIKLRVSRRHKSTECLTTTPDHHVDRSHSSTPANVSCSENSSDDEPEHHHHHSHHPNPSSHSSGHHHGGHGFTNHSQHPQGREAERPVKTEISKEALHEIEAFKQLIDRYFATHPRHDSITSHSHEIIL
ncbi:uncharacterized protein [Macrobrachium rosenbergii]|uniref:uncharacterized protein isoform X2 n=1 Tax=Macrobrachium rosenbergii TaxID=79674 RepID=UPI0034D44750